MLEAQKLIQEYNKNVNEYDDNAMNRTITNESTIKRKPAIQQNNNGASKIPQIEIIGDSHLNALKPLGLSKHNNAIVRNHPGSNTEDIKRFVVPTIIKQRGVIIIIHCECNEIGTNDIETINKVKKQSANAKLAISSVFTRSDVKGFDKKVKELNVKLKTLCNELIVFVMKTSAPPKQIRYIYVRTKYN